MSAGSLAEDGEALVAALDDWIGRSERRLGYRQSKGRTLSKAHEAQLKALGERLERLLQPSGLEGSFLASGRSSDADLRWSWRMLMDSSSIAGAALRPLRADNDTHNGAGQGSHR